MTLKVNNMKQETLEEAVAKKLYPFNDGFQVMDIDISEELQVAFVNGAKWQQEQIIDFLHSEIIERRDYSSSKMCEKVIEFIEQFKKK
jgi:hypothetical protein